MDRLISYDWPGNVRELEHFAERELIRNPRGPLSFNSVGKPTQNHHIEMTHTQKTIPRKLVEVITIHIKEVLDQTGGKVHGPAGAAALLGVNPSTLRKKMDKLGILYGSRYKKSIMPFLVTKYNK